MAYNIFMSIDTLQEPTFEGVTESIIDVYTQVILIDPLNPWRDENQYICIAPISPLAMRITKAMPWCDELPYAIQEKSGVVKGLIVDTIPVTNISPEIWEQMLTKQLGDTIELVYGPTAKVNVKAEPIFIDMRKKIDPSFA